MAAVITSNCVFDLDFTLTSLKVYHSNYYNVFKNQASMDSNYRPMNHEASHLTTCPVRVLGRNIALILHVR